MEVAVLHSILSGQTTCYAPRFNEQKIEHNPEQKEAISHIVAGSSGRAPYLIFGPPGTGKTTTLVEAIKQVGAVILLLIIIYALDVYEQCLFEFTTTER